MITEAAFRLDVLLAPSAVFVLWALSPVLLEPLCGTEDLRNISVERVNKYLSTTDITHSYACLAIMVLVVIVVAQRRTRPQHRVAKNAVMVSPAADVVFPSVLWSSKNLLRSRMRDQ